MATIENLSGEPDVAGEPKTYDLEIECDGFVYWKLGMTCRTMAKRFQGQPPTMTIKVRQLWRHSTVAKAEAHEAKLFRLHKGDRPFIGKMGPLLRGGNTELFSHDVVNGEEPPETFKVERIHPNGGRSTFACYVEYDPFSRWDTQYSWVAPGIEPDDLSVVVRARSTVSKLVVASIDYLDRVVEGGGYGMSKRAAQEAIDDADFVGTYAEAYRSYLGFRTSSAWAYR